MINPKLAKNVIQCYHENLLINNLNEGIHSGPIFFSQPLTQIFSNCRDLESYALKSATGRNAPCLGSSVILATTTGS